MIFNVTINYEDGGQETFALLADNILDATTFAIDAVDEIEEYAKVKDYTIEEMK